MLEAVEELVTIQEQVALAVLAEVVLVLVVWLEVQMELLTQEVVVEVLVDNLEDQLLMLVVLVEKELLY